MFQGHSPQHIRDPRSKNVRSYEVQRSSIENSNKLWVRKKSIYDPSPKYQGFPEMIDKDFF